MRNMGMAGMFRHAPEGEHGVIALPDVEVCLPRCVLRPHRKLDVVLRKKKSFGNLDFGCAQGGVEMVNLVSFA